MTASNNPDCFREFIGMRVKGVLFGALPWSNPEIARGTRTLIFEDGRGLTIANNGSFWIDNADSVQTAIYRKKRELEAGIKELEAVLALAGETSR